ncbi:MAG: hypothetical protein HYX94_00395 [Chloroflexi bacterium]|nr:hypothetical protein [Chloroflexota bacterium]
MSVPRLKASRNGGSLPAPGEAKPVSLPSLNISGVVVRKQELVAALRIFLPVVDIQAFEDGERFYLALDSDKAVEDAEGSG